MKQNGIEEISRRICLKTIATLTLPPFALACVGGRRRPNLPDTKVARKYHWTRRENWNGPEAVFGVVWIGDRYLLVEKTNGNGWSFPGGMVDPDIHGPKTKKNDDLIAAVTEYTHSQAMVSVNVEDTVLLAYGYAIDEHHDQTMLAHWYAVAIASSFPPQVHPNMVETKNARWVGLDDSQLGECLQNRIQEYVSAGEGGTIVIEPCNITL